MIFIGSLYKESDMKTIFKIKGLDCANCAAELEHVIKKVEGVQEVTINFMTEKMLLEYKEGTQEETMKKVKKVIKKEEPDVTIEEA